MHTPTNPTNAPSSFIGRRILALLFPTDDKRKTNMKSNDTVAALIQPFEFTELELWTFSIGCSMLGIGLLFIILSTAVEYCVINQQVKRTMVMHDAMIRPPRCDSKAREVGMETGTNWKHYFYREEPFYET